VQAAFKRHADMRRLGQRSARALIDELFEAPETRILLYHLATETGLALEEPGGDIAFLGYSLWIAGRWRIPAGGMGAYADALRHAAVTAGVEIACASPVACILVEEGRAAGIETVAGRIVRASAVLAATPLLDTFEMVDTGAIAPAEDAELAAFRRQWPGSIAGSFFCLDRAPRYKSARHDPQIDYCLKTVIGHETPADTLAQDADIRAGLLPRPAGVVRVHSLWDPALAPEGRHIAGIDSAFPAADHLDRETWKMVEAAFPQALLDMWGNYCIDGFALPPVMSCDLSAPFERRMLVRMGADQYRASIAGLYLGGPGMYPGGGVHGACGQNAAQTILADSATV
jgi:phytoene dehydrogenase-like protein